MWLSIARSIARRSLYGTCLKPGSSGSKPWWYFSWPVAVTVASVRPWNELLRGDDLVAVAGQPCSLAYLRASLIAASLASAPELQKNTRSANECSQSSLARWICGADVEEVRHVQQRGRLLADRPGHHRDGSGRARSPRCRGEVEVLLAVAVPHPRALAAHQHQRASRHSWRVCIRCFVRPLDQLSWCPSVAPSENDLGADAFVGEQLEQDRVGHAAVDDVGLCGAAAPAPAARTPPWAACPPSITPA